MIPPGLHFEDCLVNFYKVETLSPNILGLQKCGSFLRDRSQEPASVSFLLWFLSILIERDRWLQEMTSPPCSVDRIKTDRHDFHVEKNNP